LGPYEILSPIGAGGMGEVYRARDTKLDREVAVKVLPESLAKDPSALARFEREAKAVAALSHPNILAIHDFGNEHGVAYAAMELLEGRSLRDLVEAGSVAPRKAVDYARQICEGLAAAHEKGVVHRDIKPENLFLTNDGRVKILDFGLAKRQAQPPAGEETEAPTVSAATEAGTVLGTVGYMSPEQVRGLPADHRSDIFSFGAVLYEMLAGRRAFRGETTADTITAILREEPPELDASGRRILPEAFERIVRHCLEKSPDRRFQSAADIAFDLETATGPAPRAVAGPTRTSRSFIRAAVFVLAGAALGAGVAWWTRPPPSQPARVRALTFSGHDGEPSASPDGRLVAFTSTRDGVSRIWVKQLSGGEAPLTSGPDQKPRFSPDGSSVLFLRGERGGSRLAAYRIALVGGEPRRILDDVVDADWSPDGRQIAFVRMKRDVKGVDTWMLGVADIRSGRERILTKVPKLTLHHIRWRPGGREIGAIESVPIGFEPGDELLLVDAETGKTRVLAGRTSRPLAGLSWSGTGAEAVYAQAGSRMGDSSGALARVVARSVPSGRERTLFWTPDLFPTIGASKTYATTDVLGPGRLVFDRISQRLNLREFAIGGSGAEAAGRPFTQGSSRDRQPAYSPDGGTIIFSSNRSGNLDLWSLSTKTGVLKQLTDDPAQDWDPAFTPDGRHILWSSDRGGHLEIWIAAPDGSDPRQLSYDGKDAENPTVTPDGAWVVYGSANPAKSGIWKIRTDGSDARALVRGLVSNPEVSPDGRYATFIRWIGGIGLAREIGVVEIATGRVVPFEIATHYRPAPTASSVLIGRSRWLPDGRAIAWIGEDDDGRTGVFAQEFAPGRDTSESRRKLAGFSPEYLSESFGISPDGRRLTLSTLEQSSNLMLAEGLSGVEPPVRQTATP
jgi:serine/threonine protein kinase